MAAILQQSGDANSRDPAWYAAVVTPSDTVDLPYVTTAIYVGGAGALTVIMVGNQATGTTTTFSAVPVGTTLYIRASRIMATGTTATLIVAEWR